MTTYQNAVQTVASENGYGSYAGQITYVATLFESGAIDEIIINEIVRYGASPRTAERLVGQVRGLVAEHGVNATPEFDRATAAAVIRAFIQNGSRHVGNRGASEEDVTALLIIAGLEDEPEPEPEPEVVPESGVISRLVSWARGQGFRG